MKMDFHSKAEKAVQNILKKYTRNSFFSCACVYVCDLTKILSSNFRVPIFRSANENQKEPFQSLSKENLNEN